MKTTITTVSQIVEQFKADINMFGSYTMNDKGAHEMHDCQPDLEYLKSMNGRDAGQKLIELLDHPDLQENRAGNALVLSLVSSLDDQPEEWWNQMMEENPRLEKFY